MGNKRTLIIVISSVIILIVLIGMIVFGSVKYVNRTIDVSGAKHSVTIVDNTDFYKKPKKENNKIYKELTIGTNVYVLE